MMSYLNFNASLTKNQILWTFLIILGTVLRNCVACPGLNQFVVNLAHY
jgi:hypothetical protein